MCTIPKRGTWRSSSQAPTGSGKCTRSTSGGHPSGAHLTEQTQEAEGGTQPEETKNSPADYQGRSYHNQADSHYYKDRRNGNTLQSYKGQQTNKNNPADCRGLFYHNKADSHLYQDPYQGHSEVRNPGAKPIAPGYEATEYEHHLGENDETAFLPFLFHFEYQPENQAEINGIVLYNTGHAATQADG